MHEKTNIVIVGAGLAGLISAIHLAQSGIPVTLIEKDTYPRHKVCGEYISNEVLPYLERLSIDIFSLQAVDISKVVISTQKGALIKNKLPLGGFGISRYALDYFLWNKAKALGVITIQDEVTGITFENNSFEVCTIRNKKFKADFVIGAYGKRTALDTTLKKGFNRKKAPWLAVKAHYNAEIDTDTVQLHNFKGGYCGISKVENGLVNVCYLTHYDSFKSYKEIPLFQEKVLYKNPHLASFFEQATMIFEKPMSIAQINFEPKELIVNQVMMCGDAAGLIHPLCGNGMAMAISGAQLLSELLIAYDKGRIKTRDQVQQLYIKQWQDTFGYRLKTGRWLQKVLLNRTMQTTAQKIGSWIPGIVPEIIRKTHGEPLIFSYDALSK